MRTNFMSTRALLLVLIQPLNQKLYQGKRVDFSIMVIGNWHDGSLIRFSLSQTISHPHLSLNLLRITIHESQSHLMIFIYWAFLLFLNK